jgi:arylsulfatase A-like enzyme
MTPYRLFKGFTTEGGIRTPLIISGPGVADQGAHSDAFAHVMDISATILDAAGVDHPGKSYKGRKVEPLLGRSIMKVLNGKSDFVYENDTAVSWEMLGFRAVRKGDFKLVWLPLPFGNHNWQLYDLSSERNDWHMEAILKGCRCRSSSGRRYANRYEFADYRVMTILMIKPVPFPNGEMPSTNGIARFKIINLNKA